MTFVEFLNGKSATPHPNSLMFNVYPVFWPFKALWFTRKVSFGFSVINLKLGIMLPLNLCQKAYYFPNSSELP